MELLTRNNFENWMQKVMERLDRQDEMLLSMQPSGKAPNPMDGIRLFDNQDLCMLLQISKRTLQRYRSIGALPYKTLGKKTYYSEADVLTFLSEHVKDFRKEDIEGVAEPLNSKSLRIDYSRQTLKLSDSDRIFGSREFKI